MRILFIGNVTLSRVILADLINRQEDVVGVVTSDKSEFNADKDNLSAICGSIPCLKTDRINDDDAVAWIRDKTPDIIFCFGWSSLLSTTILSIPPMGVVGFHPAALPANRGRHPIIWALFLGLDKTASTFFFMDKGADTGDILSQVPIPIDDNDNAATLYQKIVNEAVLQVRSFLPELKDGTFQRIRQDNTHANTWRKRSVADGKIDFRMGRKAIYNLVRALSKPYVGAHIEYGGKMVKVWKIQEKEWYVNNIEPGKVVSVDGRSITVKCYDGAVEICEHEFTDIPDVGEYLL